MEKYCMDKEKSKEIAQILNLYLANLNVLNTKLHNYHWNVVGTDFFMFHDQLQKMYETILKYFNDVAERIVMLGSLPLGTLEEAIKLSSITESQSSKVTPKELAVDLIEDYSEMISIAKYLIKLASDNRDDTTSAILTNHIQFFEKMVWFLSAYLSKENNLS